MDSKLHLCSEGHAVDSHFFLAQGSSNCCLQRMVMPVEFKIVLEVWRKILITFKLSPLKPFNYKPIIEFFCVVYQSHLLHSTFMKRKDFKTFLIIQMPLRAQLCVSATIFVLIL